MMQPETAFGEEDHVILPRRRRSNPEALIQRAIIDRLRWFGVLAVAVPNEGKRSASAGRRLKGTGMRPGFPDLICMKDGCVVFLEVKAEKGRLQSNQAEFHDVLRRYGMRVAVVRSQDEAVAALAAMGLPL